MWFVCYLFGSMLPKLVAPMHINQCLSMADFLELWNGNCVNTHGPSPFQISKICSRLHFKLLLLSTAYVTVTIRGNYLYWFLPTVHEWFLSGSFVQISLLARIYLHGEGRSQDFLVLTYCNLAVMIFACRIWKSTRIDEASFQDHLLRARTILLLGRDH